MSKNSLVNSLPAAKTGVVLANNPDKRSHIALRRTSPVYELMRVFPLSN